MRVVSLTCSNTEIVCALGCEALLVGVDRHSDYPAEVVTKLPRVGPDLDIDVAQVRALNPDLVLASLTVPGHERILERLAAEKLPFVAPEPTSLRDVYANIRQIGELLSVRERAEPLVRELETELSAPSEPTGLRVLIEWWPKPVIVPGARSWTNDLLTFAGAENPLGEVPVKSQPLSEPDAAALAPDISVISWCGVRTEKYRKDVVLRRTSWQGLQLVQKKRVYAVPEAWLGRPGPRLLSGARELRRIVAAVRSET